MSTNSAYITLMIITDSDKGPTSIRFSRTTFRIAIGLLAVLAIAIVVVIINYGTLSTHSLERAKWVAEVDQLKQYSTKVDELEKNLAAYRAMLKKLTDLAGVDLSEFGMATIDYPGQTADDRIDRKNANKSRVDVRAHPIPQGFPVQGYISRAFRPLDENPKMRHFGVDLAVAVGTPVTATADGVVTFAGWDSTFGWKVVLAHADGVETIYGHNDSITVEVGDAKKYGDVIAISGNTGISTAPHVHYEIERNGNPVNPEEYYDSKRK